MSLGSSLKQVSFTLPTHPATPARHIYQQLHWVALLVKTVLQPPVPIVQAETTPPASQSLVAQSSQLAPQEDLVDPSCSPLRLQNKKEV